MRTIDKLFSLRVWLLCGFLAGLVSAGAGAIWSPLAGPVFVIALVLILGGYVLSPSTAAVCPYCRKRVKLGASTCHHCGQTVTGSAPRIEPAAVAPSPPPASASDETLAGYVSEWNRRREDEQRRR